MVGQALGGIICAVALVAFSSLFPDKSEGMSPHAATAYFAMALIVLCACMAGYIFVNRHPFFLYYSERAKAEERVDSMRRTGSILGKDSLLRETVTHTQPPLLQLE
jgi:Na+/melibiose symporter-like transporter